MTKPITDQKQRDLIESDFATSFFVEAGAGSGKTHSLVERMAGIIRSGSAEIEHIAAVTFTRKAASELMERFQIRLEELLKSPKISQDEKERVNNALLTFERVSISTIHSFCAKILRERPVEAGIDPGFEEIEEGDNTIFANDIWNEYIAKQGLQGNPAIVWMQENGVDYRALSDIYVQLVTFPDVEIVTQPISRPDFIQVKEDIKSFIAYLIGEMPKTEPSDGWDKLQNLVRKAKKLIDLKYLENDRLFIVLLESLNKTAGVTQKRWGNDAASKANAKQIGEKMVVFQQQVVEQALRQWREYLHKPLIDFAMGGVAYYQQWRNERSVLNFQDLLMKTAELLRNNPEVRGYFKNEIRYLLVDEFQDTDPIQAEIVMFLTGEDNSVSDWRNVRPRAGSLFLVGDPKQSIFRFRRADIDIYNQVKDIFKKGAGQIVELTSNFRSLDHIADITNATFSTIFPSQGSDYQAKYEPLQTVRGPSIKYANGIIANLIPSIKGNYRDVVMNDEAKIIAAWIYEAINGGLKIERSKKDSSAGLSDDARPSDFMILAKKKDCLSVYAHALEDLGIPYEITGAQGFGVSEELSEIVRVLKTVADPGNPVLLVAALRGLFFGISDDDLYQYVRQGGRISLYDSSLKGPEKVRMALGKLRGCITMVCENSPVTAIEKIIESLGIIPLSVSQEIGATRSGNILKMIELLRGLKPGMAGSFQELVEYFEDLLALKDPIEEMNIFMGTGRAVRIMNLHKAKGLEAPVIILADPLGGYKEHEPTRHVKRAQKCSQGYFLVQTPKVNEYPQVTLAQPALWDDRAQEETAYKLAEDNRLDYVAVTRAENVLVVGVYAGGDRARPWGAFDTYLQNVPQLSVKSMPAAQKREKLVETAENFSKETDRIAQNMSLMTEASYKVSPVTGLIHKSDVFKEGAGKGASWGKIMHNALEACGRGKRDKLETLVLNWIIDADLPTDNLPAAIVLVDAIMQSGMWQRVMQAQERYFEMPFSLLVEDRVITGTMDLVFKEQDGWVIVDYKTDDFEKDTKRKEVYQQQLSLYAKYWSELTGEPVKSTELLMVR